MKYGKYVDFDSERVESNVGKDENTGYQPFRFSLQCFKKLHCNGCLNSGLYGKGLRSQTIPNMYRERANY